MTKITNLYRISQDHPNERSYDIYATNINQLKDIASGLGCGGEWIVERYEPPTYPAMPSDGEYAKYIGDMLI